MEKYFLSIGENDLKEGEEFKYLTFAGESVIPNHRYQKSSTFHMGRGDDSRLYYLSESHELSEVVGKILSCTKEGSGIMIKGATKENMPNNLRECYEKFFERIAKK